MADPSLLVERAERIAVVTLNRPAVRNALDEELLDALPRTFADLDRDDGVDVVVLTGADPAFCAGLDLHRLGSADGGLLGRVFPGEEGASEGPWPPLRTPLIGAVNGPAVTGGLELALACDLLVASERAKFADSHARVGLLPGWGLTVLLPQAVGLRAALQMSLSGRPVDAAEALRLGLVNQVVPHAELLTEARRLAADIAGADRAAVRELLASYRRAARGTFAEGWAVERATAAGWRRRAPGPAELERRRAGLLHRPE